MNSLVDMLASLMPGVTQTHRLLRLHTPLGPNVLLPETVDGWEAVSEGAGYRFELTALSTDPFIDLDALIGQPVLLQLLTADSRVDLRPWHGHVTAFARIGSNQGAARYRLTLEPWLSFLSYTTDSTIFQNATLIDIIESVFAGYANQGKLVPSWRWALADRSIYPQRSLTSQYQETDLAFIQRLLTGHGLYYWFEHRGDAQADTLGAHTLVIADYNGAFQPESPMPIRFHRADATETTDSIQQWHVREARHSPRIHLSSWDYRTLDTRPVAAGAADGVPISTTAHDTPGLYSYPTRATGQRIADRQYEAASAQRTRYIGDGVERRLAPGLRFVLTEHPVADYDSLCLHVRHRIRNNLSAEVHAAAEQQLGGVTWTAPVTPRGFHAAHRSTHDSEPTNPRPADAPPADTAPKPPADPDFYHNHFQAIPASTAYRPRPRDGHGQRLHPQPTAGATQTALVVGTPGAAIDTDRDHRVKIQFHWQRGSQAHNRRAHPSGDDHAPASAASGTWVRVAEAQAGANWGHHFIPRIGQEVIVTFIEHDIDRPVITGALYNGQGATDDQHNRISASIGTATANAPAWFAGAAGDYAHPAVLCGLKTQAMATSAAGTGGHNQLVFDDTPNQLRTQLSTTQHATALALGHLKQQTDSARQADRGHGAELATEATGAVRAGQGVLLTTEAGNQQLSAAGAIAGIAEAHQLTQALSNAADQQQAIVAGDDKTKDRQAITALNDTHASLSETAAGTGTTSDTGDGAIKAIQGGAGDVPAWQRPDLIASAPAGIAAVTPADHILSAGDTMSLAARDINLLTQNNYAMAVAKGIRLYTQGQKASGEKPNQETGIHMHAATGPVTAQAQSGHATLAADQNVTIASTQADIHVSAPKTIRVSAGGGGLQIEGGNITLTAPGAVTFHAGQHNLTGPGQGTPESVSFPTSSLSECEWKT